MSVPTPEPRRGAPKEDPARGKRRERINTDKLEKWTGDLRRAFLERQYTPREILMKHDPESCEDPGKDPHKQLRDTLQCIGQEVSGAKNCSWFQIEDENQGLGLCIDILSALRLDDGSPALLVKYVVNRASDPNLMEKLERLKAAATRPGTGMKKKLVVSEEGLDLLLTLLSENKKLLSKAFIKKERRENQSLVDFPEFMLSTILPLPPKKAPERSKVNCTCGKPAKMWCSRCRAVAYCGKECQKADWKQHKRACVDPTKFVDVRVQADVDPLGIGMSTTTIPLNQPLAPSFKPKRSNAGVSLPTFGDKDFVVKVQVPLTSAPAPPLLVYDKRRSFQVQITMKNASQDGYMEVLTLIRSKGAAGGFKGYMSASVREDGEVLRLATGKLLPEEPW